MSFYRRQQSSFFFVTDMNQAQIHTSFTVLRKSVIINIFLMYIYIYIYIYIYKTLQVEIERWDNPPIYKALSEENGTRQYPVWMIQKPRKFIGGACQLTPLEPCALGARVGSRLVFILDLCL